MRKPIRHGLILALLLLLPAAAATANSLDVNATAKMGGTNFGLELVLLDPAVTPADRAYVAAGPSNGFSNECNLSGSFFINPQNLAMPSTIGQNHFRLLHFYKGFSSNSDVKLIVFLHKVPGSPETWFLTAWHWDESLLSGAGNWRFTGNGFFALTDNPAWSENRIDFSYTCGSPGNLTMWRTLYTGGAPGATIEMFNVPLTNSPNGHVNWVFVGMLNEASHFNGTVGSVYLDEFTFSR